MKPDCEAALSRAGIDLHLTSTKSPPFQIRSCGAIQCSRFQGEAQEDNSTLSESHNNSAKRHHQVPQGRPGLRPASDLKQVDQSKAPPRVQLIHSDPWGSSLVLFQPLKTIISQISVGRV